MFLPGSDSVPSPEVVKSLVEDITPGESLISTVSRQQVSQYCHVSYN